MIRKTGSQYGVYTKSGSRLLGRHASKADAQKQLAAIEISKHRREKSHGLNSDDLLEGIRRAR